MAQIEEASPICRGKNLSWDTVLLFYNNMPREALPKTKFHAYTEARINGWTTTHSQIARQLAFYYEENGICYPRFTQEMSYSDLFKYMQNWAAKYFIPNPYSPSLKDYEPTCIYAAILNAIESGKRDFDEIIDSIFGITLSSHDKVKVYLSNFTDLLINDAKQVSVNKRTFGIKTDLHPDKLFVTDTKRYFEYFNFDSEIVAKSYRIINEGNTLQQIFFGAPGSGKSFKLKEEILPKNDKLVFRTTFHPDTDYSSFVGCYKPQMKDDKIVYAFAPQVFTDAYVAAWNGLENKETYYLVIEEINRGNCAQIFGDLFQLLDRKKESGYSEYPIKADNDLRDYLERAETEDGGQVLINKEGIKDGKLCLPPNLNIIATMNTSDQSLFPMDSAFKRRWSWEYVPIKYDEPKSAAFAINIPDSPFEKWVNFLKKINGIILEKTDSEDKQMGNFFIKGDIEEQEFKDKVMFYLWSEVCKDSFHTKDNFFRTKDREFSYNELYGDEGHDLLLGFLDYIKNYKAKDDQTV